MSGGRAIPSGLVTERSGMGIRGITGLPRSMAFGIAASAKEMESNAARTVVSTIFCTEVREMYNLHESGGGMLTCWTVEFLYT